MAKSFTRLKEQIRELGFGNKGFTGRLINRDGSFNIEKKGAGIKSFSPYQFVINMHWMGFLLLILIAYILINLVFALLYLWAGPENLTGYRPSGEMSGFLHCFYFSSQTLTTVGFGKISPNSHLTSLIASFEAMIGLMAFALATGILYGRFSKAQAKIQFSENILIAPYQDGKGLKFRISNSRKNQLIELKARLMYSYMEDDRGTRKRRYRQLGLEIDFINMFPLPWTLVHAIDEDSPIHGKNVQDFSGEEAEFLIILKGYDDTFSQYVHQAYSYRHDEIVFDAEFDPMFFDTKDGKTVVHLNRINDHRKVYPDSKQEPGV
ncbi:MAG: ion channel [Cyclobacteriaceae bacterium]